MLRRFFLAGLLALGLSSPCDAQMLQAIVNANSASAPPSFVQGINFRANADGGTVTDCNGCSYELGGAGNTFPHATACSGCASSGNSTGIGWHATVTNTRDRNTAADNRIVGVHFISSGTNDYEVQIPSAGTYLVTLAMGDAEGGSNTCNEVQILDGFGGSVLATVGNNSTGCPTSSTTQFMASDATNYTISTWVSTGSTKTVSVTPTGSVLSFHLTTPASTTNTIAHIGICLGSCTPP